MMYVGTLIGAFTFGFLSDKFGRLIMFMISCIFLGLAGSLVTVMPNSGTFSMMRCFEGIGFGGGIVTSYVYLIEFCGVHHRELVTALFHLPINVSHMTLPVLSYLLRNCDHFQLAVSLPALLCLVVWFLSYESPKWLVESNQVKKATTVMQKIAKFDKQSPEEIKREMEEYFGEAYNKQKEHKVNFWHIFRYKKLTINFCCMAFVYFQCGMGYYGVSQYIGIMSGDIHKNVSLSGALLIPGTLTALYLLQKLGRRCFLMSTCFLAGSFMIICMIIPDNLSMVRVGLACICNCFFFISFIIVFLYGVELFPTSIRNSVLGCLSVLSRLGQIAAPPINALSETASGAVFGIVAIVAGFLCIVLPETKNIELPTTLADSIGLSTQQIVQIGSQPTAK